MSFKENKRKSFWIKLIHNELLTLDKLTIRKLWIYNINNLCRACNKNPKTREHLLVCTELEQLTANAWSLTIKKLEKNIKTLLPNNTSTNLESNTHKQRLIALLIKEIFEEKNNRLDFTTGLIQEILVKEFECHLNNKLISTSKI